MPTRSEILRSAKRMLAASRATAGVAKSRIRGSRQRVSQSQDTIVSTASVVTATRSALGKPHRP
jgi:hypothetical protein